MKIAVMQPYFMPYIGYFQMIKAVDVFVFYDDVNYIKQGWINRNKLLIAGQDKYITVPIEKANSFNLIKDTRINHALFENWKKKFYTSLTQNYAKAPYFETTYLIIKEILESDYEGIRDLAIKSVVEFSKYLNINTKFKVSSESYNNAHLGRTERLINICQVENANQYINAIGGKELYNKNDFLKHGVDLKFIKTRGIAYRQFNNEFVPWLSIVDVAMFNSPEQIQEMLANFDLL